MSYYTTQTCHPDCNYYHKHSSDCRKKGINIQGIVSRKESYKKVNVGWSGEEIYVANAILSDDYGEIALVLWGADAFSIVDGDEIRIEDGITRYDPHRKCFTVSAGYNGRIEKITTHSQNNDYTRDYQESYNYSHSNSYERQESSRFHVYTGKWSYLNFWERSDYVKETYQSQTIDSRLTDDELYQNCREVYINFDDDPNPYAMSFYQLRAMLNILFVREFKNRAEDLGQQYKYEEKQYEEKQYEEKQYEEKSNSNTNENSNIYEKYFEVLGLNSHATWQEVKSAYRKLVLKAHPDKNKASDAEENFKKIQDAYEKLHEMFEMEAPAQ
tara:strand:- start:2063 stop:3046 length:984 start_codon:yes stop_codon:yes gene_type:complete